MDLATILAGIFFVTVFFIYSKSRKTPESTGEAPEPGGAWPIIGHLPVLMGNQVPHIILGHLADKLGPIFALRLGLHKALVVSTWEVAKECLATNDKAFSTRPPSVTVEMMGYNDAFFGFGPYGAYWREIRKIAIHELLSNQRLESLKHIWVSEIGASIKQLLAKQSQSQSTPVEMQQWFGDVTLNIFVRIVAGKLYFGGSDDEDAKRFQKATREFFHLAGKFMVADAIPALRWLDYGHEKAIKRIAKELDSILTKWLEEHREKISDAGEGEGDLSEQDFMDVMLKKLDDKELFGYKADIANKATCLNMILAGTDTTGIALTWALACLLSNPQALKKAQDEIDTQVGKDKRVNDSDIGKLVYLQAVVKESMRLYPPGPLMAPREAMEDCSVAGYRIPAGTRLIVNVRKIQRDPRIWSDPDVFRPERFLGGQARIDIRGQDFELLPFGSGRRICPGISMALQVVQLTLARLLQGFDFRSPSDGPVDMTESPGLTNFKARPLELIVTPRLSSGLY